MSDAPSAATPGQVAAGQNKVEKEAQVSADDAAPPALEELWAEYRKAPTETLQLQIACRYLEMVKEVAGRVGRKLPRAVEREDLEQMGFFGLMDAIEKFNPKKKTKFKTYAPLIIRGKILDGIREGDWVPRLVRQRSKRVEQVRRVFEMKEGRPPTEEEVEARLGVKSDEVKRYMRDGQVTGMQPLQPAARGREGDAEVVGLPEDERADDPALAVQQADMRDLLTRGMDREERLILMLYYHEKMTMAEIGVTLGVSESRVSQKHGELVERVRAAFMRTDAGTQA